MHLPLFYLLHMALNLADVSIIVEYMPIKYRNFKASWLRLSALSQGDWL